MAAWGEMTFEKQSLDPLLKGLLGESKGGAKRVKKWKPAEAPSPPKVSPPRPKSPPKGSPGGSPVKAKVMSSGSPIQPMLKKQLDAAQQNDRAWRKKNESATKMQAMSRASQARARAAAERAAKQQQAAAIKVQCMSRSKSAREVTAQARAEKAAHEQAEFEAAMRLEDEQRGATERGEREAAVTKLTSLVRGRSARRVAAEKALSVFRKFTFGAGPLGLELFDSLGGQTVINEVKPGLQAAAQGVQPGGEILKLNHTDVTKMNKVQISQLIATLPRPLSVTFAVPPDYWVDVRDANNPYRKEVARMKQEQAIATDSRLVDAHTGGTLEETSDAAESSEAKPTGGAASPTPSATMTPLRMRSGEGGGEAAAAPGSTENFVAGDATAFGREKPVADTSSHGNEHYC